jgi:Ca2+-binding EF-hand superfamily protein
MARRIHQRLSERYYKSNNINKKLHLQLINSFPSIITYNIGQLDKKKFVDAYKAFYPQGKADKFCNHVFKVFDFDNSGQIDFTGNFIGFIKIKY